jgi:hypothetical protein
MTSKPFSRLLRLALGADCILWRKSVPQSMPNGRWRHSAASVERPIGQAFRLAVCRQVRCLRRVALVLGVTRPTTVTRLIGTIVVDAVDLLVVSVSSGPRPFSEDGEFSPRFADRNTAAAIASVAVVIGIAAALLHTIPHAIQARSLPGPVVPVTNSGSSFQASFAAARPRIRQQLERANETLCAAGATAWIQDDVVRAAALTSLLANQRTKDSPPAELRTGRNRQRTHGEIVSLDAKGNRHVS